MKDKILKIAGVKSEKEFYKKFPTEEAFMAKHGKQLKKAEMGSKMVNTQLHQLTDFGNPPEYAGGGPLSAKTPPQFINPTGQTSSMWNLGNSYAEPMTMPQQGGYQIDYANENMGTPATQYDNISMVNPDQGIDWGATGMSAATSAADFIGGAQKFAGNIQKKEEARRFAAVSKVAGQAGTTREKQQHTYVRPEDYLVMNPYSQGTQAKNGTEIQNTYAPGNLYNDLGYEPLNDSNPKQYKKGGGILRAGMGSAIGTVAGTAFGGPVGGAIGSAIGSGVDMLIEGDQQAQIKDYVNEGSGYLSEANYQKMLQNGPFSKSMKDGGYMDNEHAWMSNGWQPQVITHFGDLNVSQVHNFAHQGMDSLRAGGHLKEYTPPSAAAMSTERPRMALGGEIDVHWGGGLEPISNNPYDASEILMPRGQSHEESDGKGRTGIGITYGDNPVEVERGEPIVKMQDGGNTQSAEVFGNIIEDESGKKYKVLAKDIAENNNKQNKLIEKATARAADYQDHTPFDQFKLNSSMATLTGADMKLKQNSDDLKYYADKQNLINMKAQEHGLDADSLAKGKIKQAKKGDKISKAATGTDLANSVVKNALGPNYSTDAITPIAPMQYSYEEPMPDLPKYPMSDISKGQPAADTSDYESPVTSTKPSYNKSLGYAALSQVMPFLRPGVGPIDPRQFSSEQFALANNQLQPVYAQQLQFEPLQYAAKTPIQDMLNEVDMQTRAAQRLAGGNSLALSQIAATAAEQKNKIRAGAIKEDMSSVANITNANRQLRGQTQAQNQQILANQQEKASIARSKTLDTTERALASMDAKRLQYEKDARDLAIKKNLYNYDFTPGGVAYSTNAPHFFNMEGTGTSSSRQQAPAGFKFTYNDDGSVADMKAIKAKSGAKLIARNGAIVKAIKSL